MQESQIKKISRDAPFFEPSRFKNFDDDLKSLKILIQPKAIYQLYIKCYGYGSFQDGENNIQKQTKDNFILYLHQALDMCQNLKILKIEFNGFDISDKCLLQIIQEIEDAINKYNREIEVLWLHTRFLQKCDVEMFRELLSFTQFLLSKKKIQEISLQISGWQFKEGPMDFKMFLKLFCEFTNNIMPMAEYTLRRFKLDLSSLYISDLQAYNFLQEAIPEKILMESIQNKRFDENQNDNNKTSQIKPQRLAQSRQEINKYLSLIDDKFAIEHPIPGRSNYISREPEYQKRKKDYIYKMLQKDNSQKNKEQLLKVFHQERGMQQIHKDALRKIKEEIDSQMDSQAKRIHQSEVLVQQTNDIQRRIAQKFIKFPFDFIMAQRVSSFHRSIKGFVAELVQKLGRLEQLQLDMRNWNSSFQMGELKKTLAKQFALGGVKPILHQGSKIVAQKQRGEQVQQTIDLKCKFIM